jgi:hypothetical protein
MTAYLIEDSGSKSPHDLATLSNGTTIYAFLRDSSTPFTFYIYKSTDTGENWSELTTVSSTTIWGSASISSYFSVQVDGSDNIHVAAWRYNDDSVVAIKWRKFLTASDTWTGSWETVASTDSTHQIDKCLCCLDNNGYPWIFWSLFAVGSGTTYYIKYKDRTSGSWSSEGDVPIGGTSIEPDNFGVVVHDSNTITLGITTSQDPGETTTTKIIRVKMIGGSWQSRDVLQEGPWDLCGKGILETSNGTPIIYGNVSGYGDYVLEDGNPVGYISPGKADEGDIWSALNRVGNTIICAMIRTNVMYVNKRNESEAWVKENAYQWSSTSYGYLYPEYNLHFNNTGPAIHLLFWDPTTYYLYFERINLSADASGSKPAYTAVIAVDTSSIPAFLRGGANPTSSKHVYLSGFGQELTPDSDVYVGSWKNETGGSILYASLADNSASTYVWYSEAVIGQYFEVGLSDPIGAPGVGNHTIVWDAYKKDGVASVTLKCELRQGNNTMIASDTEVLSSSSIVTFRRVLTSGEITLISDYEDLRIRITIMAIT